MRGSVLAAVLLAGTAFSQDLISSGSALSASSVVQQTPGTGALNYYVDGTLGSDTNACVSSGAGACATIQGAENKIPKMMRDGVTVNVAAGNYGCFYVSEFDCDPSIEQTSGGLMIDGLGAFVNSTLATGTATGTATAGSAGSGTTFGTLTDGAATWTVNDLTGRFVTPLKGHMRKLPMPSLSRHGTTEP